MTVWQRKESRENHNYTDYHSYISRLTVRCQLTLMFWDSAALIRLSPCFQLQLFTIRKDFHTIFWVQSALLSILLQMMKLVWLQKLPGRLFFPQTQRKNEVKDSEVDNLVRQEIKTRNPLKFCQDSVFINIHQLESRPNNLNT
ncbi:unnamed protein product [Lactuca virosa]|uniref:Uncharacterized protein n=1 Tax=Lactuca virosa TaxID=75947 RepID=A0AAU9N5Q3_9ASTR|nr:unnamed protein product [Lactuca virosa]